MKPKPLTWQDWKDAVDENELMLHVLAAVEYNKQDLADCSWLNKAQLDVLLGKLYDAFLVAKKEEGGRG